MKKISVIFLLLFFLFTSASSLEWGGLFTEEFKCSTTDLTVENSYFKQGNLLSLWVKVPVSNSGNWSFSTQTTGKYELTNKSKDLNFSPVFDVDLLKLSGLFNFGNTALNLSMGRFSVEDISGKVFNQMCDGVLLKYSVPSVQFSGYLGYTGFLNAYDVSIINKSRIVEPITEDIYAQTHKYIPIIFSISVPSLFKTQSLNVQFSMFIDKGNQEELFNRNYASLSLCGPVAGSVYYSLFSVFGFENMKNVTNYSMVSLQFVVSSVISLKIYCEYASGNQLIFAPFTGFTSNTAYYSSENPEICGFIMPEVDFILDFTKFYLGLSGKVVLGYPEEEIFLKGTNLTSTVMWNIFSDLQLGLTASYYLDVNNKGKENNCFVNIKASLAF